MRKIDKIIIHCSATPEGRDISVEQIDAWHRQRGFAQIGYHFVIYRDGSVHIGRPLSKIGAHCRGHNASSIGICYIGGVDSHGLPKDTRTSAQRAALKRIVENFRIQFPGISVHGHREFSDKNCPSFDVITDPSLNP